MTLDDRSNALKDTQVVVLGANGFVGAHVCRELNRFGCRPQAVVRSTSTTSRLDTLEADVAVVRIEDAEELTRRLSGEIDAVVNCATAYARKGANKRTRVVEANIQLPLAVLEATSSACAFIQLDTFSAVGAEKHAGLPEYHLSKRHLREWLKLDKERTVVQARLEHVYGPFDSEDKFVTFVLDAFRNGVEAIALTEGRARRDFIHVNDVARAICHLVDGAVGGRIKGHREFEVGTGQATSVREFVELAKDIAKARTQLDFGARASPAVELEESFANLALWDDVGWQPAISLSEGIAQTLRAEEAVAR